MTILKAVVYTKYGPPEVLQLKEVAKPIPKENEVLIQIKVTDLTPADCAMRRADPFITRFFAGLFKPKNKILGVELSGEIEAVGQSVTRFKTGDRVFGAACMNLGAFAEYICLPETATLCLKPDKITYAEAVTICDGALTALPFLRDKGKVQGGQSVLINGASGSVGIAAVQLAKYYGAEVTGVCSTAKLEFVRSFGADHVIDYTREDFTKRGQTYDIIFDAIGKSSYSHCKGVLKKNGIYLTTVPTLAILFQMMWTSMGSGKKAVFGAMGLRSSAEQNKDLVILRELMETGKIKPVIDRSYPLEQMIEAHKYVESERKNGTVVIAFGHSESESR